MLCSSRLDTLLRQLRYDLFKLKQLLLLLLFFVLLLLVGLAWHNNISLRCAHVGIGERIAPVLKPCFLVRIQAEHVRSLRAIDIQAANTSGVVPAHAADTLVAHFLNII